MTKILKNKNLSSYPIDYRLVHNWLIDAGDEAISQQHSLTSFEKKDHTLVTNIDSKIEQIISKKILDRYPDHSILSEEGTFITQKEEFLWIIDPIDGTRAYASGLPLWSISIGLFYLKKPFAGFVYIPKTTELFWNIRNTSYYGNRVITHDNNKSLEDQTAFIAVPSNFHKLYNISFNRLRSFGSTSIHLVYVACGFASAAITRCISIWDIAGVLPILRSSKIDLRYLSGKKFQEKDLLNGNPSHEPLIAAPIRSINKVRRMITLKN